MGNGTYRANKKGEVLHLCFAPELFCSFHWDEAKQKQKVKPHNIHKHQI
jgi:hypothetical protein